MNYDWMNGYLLFIVMVGGGIMVCWLIFKCKGWFNLLLILMKFGLFFWECCLFLFYFLLVCGNDFVNLKILWGVVCWWVSLWLIRFIWWEMKFNYFWLWIFWIGLMCWRLRGVLLFIWRWVNLGYWCFVRLER